MRATIVSTKSPWTGAIADGLRRHDVTVHLGAKPADFVVCWGWRTGRYWRERGHTVLLMERGYVGDRFSSLSLGWNGLNRRATFPWGDDGGERWRSRFGRVLPWRHDGEYVLLIGQVRHDAAVHGVDILRWYEQAAETMGKRFGGMPVLFRPHPDEVRRGRMTAVSGVPTLHGHLAPALDKAALVVTYNSGAGIDAVLSGVPVIACDEGSMVWDVAAHGLDAEPIRPARDAWCARLAWCQWSLDEVRSGAFWEHLKGCMA